MSAFATIYVTREAAQNFALRKLLSCSDEQLAEVLEVFLTSRLYNCRITCDNESNDNELLT